MSYAVSNIIVMVEIHVFQNAYKIGEFMQLEVALQKRNSLPGLPQGSTYEAAVSIEVHGSAFAKAAL